MKIISGVYKNREVLSPDDSKTHPMGSREKLALFNMLLPFLPSSVVLDAFSGSGALGFESLSRGALKVVFVENSPKVARIIEKNCQNLNLPPEKYQIIKKDINKVDFQKELFDIILADPPYDFYDIKEIENLVKFLKPSGILALSSPKTASEATLNLPNVSPLKLLSSHTYAAAEISIFQKV